MKFAAAYKRPSEANSRKTVVEAHLETPWQPATEVRPPLPVALDLAGLYEHMLKRHTLASPTALPPRPGEPRQSTADLSNMIRAKENECRQLETRIKAIRFNRRVEIKLRSERATPNSQSFGGSDSP